MPKSWRPQPLMLTDVLVDRRVAISITGLMPERVFAYPWEAGKAAWAILKPLPLGWTTAEAFREFLCCDLEERLDDFFKRRTEVDLTFELGSESHLLRITRVGEW